MDSTEGLRSPSCVILMGIPASGKSSFYKVRFADSHVRINRDMLGTPFRERTLAEACLRATISFVVDKTNVTRDERRVYITAAKEAGYFTVGYFLQSRLSECMARNRLRPAQQCVPDAALGGMSQRLELPSPNEGFDALFFVSLEPGGSFTVQPWAP